MDSKLLVFVVLVSLGQGAFAQRSTPLYGLSEEDLAVLNKVRAYHDAAISAAYETNISLYEFIKKFLFGFIYDLKPTTSYDDEAAAMIVELKRVEKTRSDNLLNAISTALRKRCNDLERTRTTIYAIVDDIYSKIQRDIRLAQSGRYSKQKKSSVLALVGGLVTEFYNLIRRCLNTTDAKTLAAIETVESRSLTGIYYESTSLSNVLRLVSIAIASGNKSRTLIDEVDAAFPRGFAGARADINNKGGLLEALYIDRVFNRRGIVPALNANQYAGIVRSYNFMKTVTIFFRELFDRIYKISLGLLKESEEVFTRTDSAEAETAALYADGSNVLIGATSYLDRRDFDEDEDTWKALNALTKKVAANFYLMIKWAVDEDETFSRSRAEIDILESKLVDLFRKITNILIRLFSGYEDSSDETRNVYEIYEKDIALEISNYIRSFRNGATLLANAAHQNGPPSTDYIRTLRTFERSGKLAADNYEKSIANLFRVALLVSER